MIKSSEEVAKMRLAGNLASKVLIMIEDFVKPGVTTQELNDICHDYIVNELDCIMRNNTSVTPLLLQSTRVPDEYDTFLPGVISGKVLPQKF